MSNNEEDTSLCWASSNDHLQVVEALLAAKADVSKRDKDGRSPPHAASYKGHLEVVEALLTAETDVNKSDRGRRISAVGCLPALM